MKQTLPKILLASCILLAVALLIIKRSDNARHDSDITTITDYSNRLDLAQGDITTHLKSIFALSNTLATTSLALSNQLAEAQSTIALQTEQITNLTRQASTATADNELQGRNVLVLVQQVNTLTEQLALTETRLAQTNSDLVQLGKDYALLQNRFLRDVAERVLVARKFNNPDELRAQLQSLKTNPAGVVSAELFYASLNVVVNSNGTAHVISPE